MLLLSDLVKKNIRNKRYIVGNSLKELLNYKDYCSMFDNSHCKNCILKDKFCEQYGMSPIEMFNELHKEID